MFNLLKRSDVRQVRQVLSGQSEAFGPLVDRYLPAVYAVSYAYLGNHADAEDVTQEAFVSAYTSLHTLKEPKKFEGWVVSIARQTASKLRRKQRREDAATAALPTDAIHQPDPGREELRRLLRAEIDRMDDEPREVLLLHYHAGMNAREIAAVLDINREAVKKRLQRARQSLSDNLLAVIGEDGHSKTDHGRQRSAIMGLVAAAGLGWTAGAGGSRGLASSMALPMRLGGGALAVAVILGAVYVTSRSVPTREPAEGVLADALSASDLRSAHDEIISVPIETTAEDNADEPGESLEESPAAASLTGYWRACNLVTNTGFFSSWNGKSDIVYLKQIDDAVTMYAMSNGEKKSVAGHGTIEGGQLRLALPTSDGPVIGKHMSIKSDSSNPAVDETEPAAPDIAPAPVPAGESPQIEEVSAAKIREETKGEDAASSTQELVCSGTLSDGDSMMLSCKVEGGTKNPPFTQDSEFTRLTERDVAELKITVERIRELEALANALKAYHTTNDSTYPEELSALNDGYLELPQLTVSGGSRIIEYNRDSLDPSLMLSRASSSTVDATDALHQQNLLRREEDALTNWPEYPYLPALLRIRYSAPPMILQIREANPSSVERVDLGNVLRCSTSLVDAQDPDTIEKLKVSCQNNMKQLGLCVRVFREDDGFNRAPAGWAMMFGSYISDDVMLTCPGRREANEPGRTSSYTLLFPAINNDELKGIVAEMGLKDSNFDEIKRMVPAIIENHPCADGKSRNVVFWDGHAERIEDARWAEVIAPFVRAGDKYVGDLLTDVG